MLSWCQTSQLWLVVYRRSLWTRNSGDVGRSLQFWSAFSSLRAVQGAKWQSLCPPAGKCSIPTRSGVRRLETLAKECTHLKITRGPSPVRTTASRLLESPGKMEVPSNEFLDRLLLEDYRHWCAFLRCRSASPGWLVGTGFRFRSICSSPESCLSQLETLTSLRFTFFLAKRHGGCTQEQLRYSILGCVPEHLFGDFFMHIL